MLTRDQGFYRRPLPAPLVPFASEEGRALFREALAEGHMEGWFALAEQFHTQADPAFCGLGTLVVALNALGVDPGRLWKGPWRWYSEELLDCCLPLESVRARGITLDQFACLARCNGATADVRRAGEVPLEAFRADLRAASSSADGLVLAVSYARRALGQTGEGHFSPVAGLHVGRDLALVLDVARFKYPPHWVPVAQLWEAMQTSDPATGRPRGWALLRRRAAGTTVLFHLAKLGLPWAELTRNLLLAVPAALSSAPPRSVSDVVRAVIRSISVEGAEALGVAPTTLDSLAPEHRAQVRSLLDAIRGTALYEEVSRVMPDASDPSDALRPTDVMTMLLLSLPAASFDGLDPALREGVAALRSIDASPSLCAEIEVLRVQIVAFAEDVARDYPPRS